MVFPYAELEKSFTRNWQPNASWIFRAQSKKVDPLFFPQLKKNWIGKHTFIFTLKIVFSFYGLKSDLSSVLCACIYAWSKWDLRQIWATTVAKFSPQPPLASRQLPPLVLLVWADRPSSDVGNLSPWICDYSENIIKNRTRMKTAHENQMVSTFRAIIQLIYRSVSFMSNTCLLYSSALFH